MKMKHKIRDGMIREQRKDIRKGQWRWLMIHKRRGDIRKDIRKDIREEQIIEEKDKEGYYARI